MCVGNVSDLFFFFNLMVFFQTEGALCIGCDFWSVLRSIMAQAITKRQLVVFAVRGTFILRFDLDLGKTKHFLIETNF